VNLPDGVKALEYGPDVILTGRNLTDATYSDILLLMKPEDRNRCMRWIRTNGNTKNSE